MTEDQKLLWGFGLLGASFLLVVIELFIPSGGLIAIVAGIAAVGGIVAFWTVDWVWGVISMGVAVVGAVAAFNFAIKVMPYTPFGKDLLLGDDPEQAEAERLEAERERRETEQALVGATGVAKTDMYPVGAADIDGMRVEVLAEGGAIDAGTPVRVTSVEGNQVKVRAIEP
ncbi:MAG: NfeD family protein [Planctomycetota bacterium]